ncbi:MAG: flippase-like domain-containing protein [Bdellovibrionales bacterium]|nr:flippase-like domain-containing protein [Bdellovibrionales bacterium]
MTKSAARSTVATLLKLTVVALLLYFLGKKGLFSLSEMTRVLEFPGLLWSALGISSICTLLGIYRWKLLLMGQGIQLSWGRSIQLSFLGNFFNLALPGAVSGDLVKAFYIAQEFPGKRGHAFGSILFDRIVGVSGLVLVSALAMVAGYGPLHESHVFEAVQWFVLFSGLGVLAFFLYLFIMPERSDPALLILHTLQKKVGVFASVVRIYEGVRNYHRHRWLALYSLLISCVIHILAATNCVLFTLALEPGTHALNFPGLYALAPLGLLATALPLAPAGVGTGHAAFSWLYLLLGYKTGANVFNLVVVYQILWSAIGGIIYLRYKAEIPEGALTAEKS